MFSLWAGCHVLVLSSSAYSLFSTICYTIDSRLWKKIIGDKKKTIFTSLIKIINISNCRQEKGGTKIWSVWFLRWHEVTHATTSIIKIVYSNWRPQIKKYLHVLHGLLHMKDVHTHRGSFAITVGILLFHIWVNFKMLLFLPAIS